MKTIVNNLMDRVTRMDRHREDIDWQREECILLRVGLQENEDRTAKLSVRGEQMSRQLCRCVDHQGPPISAVGSPLPPPYARSASPEFHIPPIKVCLIDDAETAPPSPAPVLVPPLLLSLLFCSLMLRTFLRPVVPILLPPELRCNQ